ncbi:hypothetical protein ACJX0J_019530, partial [Zea mays]
HHNGEMNQTEDDYMGDTKLVTKTSLVGLNRSSAVNYIEVTMAFRRHLIFRKDKALLKKILDGRRLICSLRWRGVRGGRGGGDGCIIAVYDYIIAFFCAYMMIYDIMH